MADPVTDNISLILMATGTASGQWGAVLNAANFTPLDAILGSTLSVPVSSSDVNLSSGQRQNLAFKTTGTLTGGVSITIPLSPNSTTVAEGGFFIFENNATGSFGITVKTIASGSIGVSIPQGARSLIYSDGQDAEFADDAQNRIIGYGGNPNGALSGTAAGTASRASQIIDYTSGIRYLCTATGTSGSAVWSQDLPYSFASQGYLTANSNATNVVLTSDSLGATTIYYSAFRGNLFFVYNGVSFVPVTITAGQMALALSSTFQAASKIYDVIGFLDGSTPTIGFSPAWADSGSGSGSRGSGASTAQLARVKGILVNAVAQTVNNGATTYSVAANRGTYLGSVFVDTSAGQVTCHVNYGQSRKWGIWNAYNRLPIFLKAGDNQSTWTVSGISYSNFRASNGDSTNRISVFTGLAEETIACEFSQRFLSVSNDIGYSGIGVNTSTTNSGTAGVTVGADDSGSTAIARLRLGPDLGANNIQAIESRTTAGGSITAYGTAAFMMLSAQYNA